MYQNVQLFIGTTLLLGLGSTCRGILTLYRYRLCCFRCMLQPAACLPVVVFFAIFSSVSSFLTVNQAMPALRGNSLARELE